MAEPKSHVDAVFDGRTIRFELLRDYRLVASLEGAIGSPLAAMRRFKSGEWLVGDVRAVLAHAFPGAVPMHRLTRSALVDGALAARPPAVYAPLAMRVLEAFLFGLDAERAHFDEARPF